MKKIIGLSLISCLGLSLFAFTTADVKNANFKEVSVKDKTFTVKCLKTFQETQESATTSDQGTWTKYRKVWTDEFAKTNDKNSIEKILEKN